MLHEAALAAVAGRRGWTPNTSFLRLDPGKISFKTHNCGIMAVYVVQDMQGAAGQTRIMHVSP